MTAKDVDEYLSTAPEPQRTTLGSLRSTITTLLPEADQVISYGVPCFKVNGRAVAGFGFAENHCTYFPMSGSITTQLADDLRSYATAKGSIRFAKDEPLPEGLVKRLIEARQREIQLIED